MLNARTIVATVSAAAALVVTAASPVQAAPPSYVALGDSYSSGTGTRSYLDDQTSCQRSVDAYPSLIAVSRGYALNFRACSGATIADVAGLQLDALGAGTAYVSISVGGNDAGFGAVLTECAKPAWASNCNGAVDRAQAIISDQIPARLGPLFASIAARAPRARVVVAGYPRLFNGEDCSIFTWFSTTEEIRLNATADLVNAKLAVAARNAGFDFRNPTSTFAGHAVCDDAEWLNGLSNPIAESYHPSRVGHSAGYTPLIGPALTGTPVTVTAATTAAAKAAAPGLADQQRRYAARDKTVVIKPFRAPDLSSPQIKKAAARAGVNLSSRASIDAADAKYAEWQSRSR